MHAGVRTIHARTGTSAVAIAVNLRIIPCCVTLAPRPGVSLQIRAMKLLVGHTLDASQIRTTLPRSCSMTMLHLTTRHTKQTSSQTSSMEGSPPRPIDVAPKLESWSEQTFESTESCEAGGRCSACGDWPSAGTALAALPCDHWYCPSCLEDMVRMAMNASQPRLPRCCVVVPVATVRDHLGKALAREYEDKKPEMMVKDKTYCHVPDCSTFIKPHSIHNGQAFCQSCRAATCEECKAAWHFGPCTEGDFGGLVKLAKQKRWPRCPGCKRIVEREEGCDSMW